jgi:TonB family protein
MTNIRSWVPSSLLALGLVACATGGYVSEPDYQRLSKAMAALEGNRPQEAEALIRPLLSSPSPRTRAIAYQTLGYVQALQERPEDAIVAYRAALAIKGGLPPDVAQQMQLNIAELLARTGRCSEAVPAFEQWHTATGKPYGKGTGGLVVCLADGGHLDQARALFDQTSTGIANPTPAWEKIGSDLALARQGKAFPTNHFQRTLYDIAYFGTRPVTSVARCPLQAPASHADLEGDGKITLEVSVDAQGRATDARITETSLPEAWRQAAISAVMKCEFRPALKDGKPVPGTTTYVYTRR